MTKTFEYKGYMGSTEISADDMVLYGKILYVNDVVTYQGDTMAELKAAFEESVDDYLETCELLGKQPDKPLKGSFNVRIGPELHKAAARFASQAGVSLNDLMKSAIEEKLGTKVEHHHHTHYHTVTPKRPLVTGSYDSSEPSWEMTDNVLSFRKEASH